MIFGKRLPELPKIWSVVGIIGFVSSMMGVGGGAFFISYFTAYNVINSDEKQISYKYSISGRS